MSESQVCTVDSESALDKAVDALLRFAEGRKKVALVGDLGAGKTAFAKAFCRRLNVLEIVTSPTFALVNEYVFVDDNGQEQLVHHLDLYRLRTLDEALGIGIDEYLYDEHFCLIEWPEIISDYLPEEVVFVKIEVQQDGRRRFSFSNNKT